jgi:aspartyl protease family protein
VVGRGASGDVRGQVVTIRTMAIDGKRADEVSGVVLENSDLSLLGQSYLRRLASVQISGDTMTLR